ncbi:hypothetical protein B0A48_06867 [Cryoendolithus antarcticus]|uniref:NAD(P)-binding domain-containing protein n=1 Tax=Cryoendolithus antarcticus TaxID=1507870 RepID=A0A1V8T9I8_9PEZI|nr:hypothetical protein B0A48_06867 [Cryoendolithus antarcticus]
MLQGKGYRVASVSRSGAQINDQNTLSLTYDLSTPTNVSAVFKKVRDAWGEPSMIVYNGAALHPTNYKTPFDVSLEHFEQDLAISSSATGTFVFVGNCLNEAPLADKGLLTLGTGKSAAAFLVSSAANAAAANEKDSRFYYIDQRTEQGDPMLKGVDGAAHAEFIEELIDGKANVPALATFVKDQGYKSFPRLT